MSWNDYLVAVVFLRSQSKHTLPLGVEVFGGGASASVMAIALVVMAPPVILFTCLHRFFSVGGIGGALVGE